MAPRPAAFNAPGVLSCPSCPDCSSPSRAAVLDWKHPSAGLQAAELDAAPLPRPGRGVADRAIDFLSLAACKTGLSQAGPCPASPALCHLPGAVSFSPPSCRGQRAVLLDLQHTCPSLPPQTDSPWSWEASHPSFSRGHAGCLETSPGEAKAPRIGRLREVPLFILEVSALGGTRRLSRGPLHPPHLGEGELPLAQPTAPQDPYSVLPE